jgi:hypothetical protein
MHDAVLCAESSAVNTSPETSLALLQTELAKTEEESEVNSDTHGAITKLIKLYVVVIYCRYGSTVNIGQHRSSFQFQKQVFAIASSW